MQNVLETDPAKPQDAPTPSNRLSSTDARPAIAANRHTDPAKLSRVLRGELDWIVMKALAKERDRRYETANGLARDVERFLKHEPVLAGPPGAGYRLKKFARRNRGAVVAASLLFLSLLAGIAGTTYGLIAADRARMAETKRAEGERLAKLEAQSQTLRAEQAAQAERAARENETAERKYAQAIASFVADDFLALTSVEGQHRFGGRRGPELSKDTTLRELLNRAATKLEERHDLDPRIEAGLCWMIGENLRGVGEYTRSVAFLERCVALRRRALGAEHAETLKAQHSLAVAYKAAGQPEKAIALYIGVRDSWVKSLGTDHPDTLSALANLAAAYQSAGNIRQAVALFERVRDAEAKTLGADHPSALVTLNDLGLAYSDAGMLPKAIEVFEHVRGVRVKTLGVEHPDTVGTVNNLALAYRAAGRLPEAVVLFEQVRNGWVKTLGAEHPDTLTALNNLALAYHDAGKLPEAIALFEQVRDANMKNLGTNHPNTLGTLNNLAMSYKDTGKLQAAIDLLEQVRDARLKTQGADHPDTLTTLNNLGVAYQAAQKLPEAIALLEKARSAAVNTLGAEHPVTLTTLGNLACAYQDAGNVPQAIGLFEQAATGLEKRQFQYQHAGRLMCKAIAAFTAANQLDKAECWRRKWLEYVRQHDGTASAAGK